MSLPTPQSLRSEADTLDAVASRDHQLAATLWGRHSPELTRAAEARAVRIEDNALILRLRAAEIEAVRSLMAVVA